MFICDTGAHPGDWIVTSTFLSARWSQQAEWVQCLRAQLFSGPESTLGHIDSENSFWAARVLPYLGKYQNTLSRCPFVFTHMSQIGRNDSKDLDSFLS